MENSSCTGPFPFSRNMNLRARRVSAEHAFASSRHRSLHLTLFSHILFLVNLNPVLVRHQPFLVGVAAERPGFLAQTPKPDPGKENDRGGGVALQRAIIEWDNYLFDAASSMLQQLYSKTKEVAVGMMLPTAEKDEAGSANGIASTSSSIKRKHPDGRKKWQPQNKVEKQETNSNNEDLIPAGNEFLDEQEGDSSKSERSSAVEKKKKFLDDKTQADTERERRGATGLRNEDPERLSSRGSGRGGKNDFLGDEEEEPDDGPKTGSSALEKNNAGPRLLPPGEQSPAKTRQHKEQDELTEGTTAAADDTPDVLAPAPARGGDDDPAAQSALQAAQSALQDDEVQQGANGPREDHVVKEKEFEKSTLQNKKEDSTDINPQQAAPPPEGAPAGEGPGPGEKAGKSSMEEAGADRLLSSGGNGGRDLNHHHLQGRAAITEVKTKGNDHVPPGPEQDRDARSNMEVMNKNTTTSSEDVFLISSSTTSTTTTTTPGPSITTTVPVPEDTLPDAPSIPVPTTTPSVDNGNSVLAASATSTAVVVSTTASTSTPNPTTTDSTTTTPGTSPNVDTATDSSTIPPGIDLKGKTLGLAEKQDNVEQGGREQDERSGGESEREEKWTKERQRGHRAATGIVDEDALDRARLQESPAGAAPTFGTEDATSDAGAGAAQEFLQHTKTPSDVVAPPTSTASSVGGTGKTDVKSPEQKPVLKEKDGETKDEKGSSVMEKRKAGIGLARSAATYAALSPMLSPPPPSPIARAVLHAELYHEHPRTPVSAPASALAGSTRMGGITGTAAALGSYAVARARGRPRESGEHLPAAAAAAAGGRGGRDGGGGGDRIALLSEDADEEGKPWWEKLWTNLLALGKSTRIVLDTLWEDYFLPKWKRDNLRHWLLKGGNLEWSLFEDLAKQVLKDVLDEFEKMMNKDKAKEQVEIPQNVKEMWEEMIIEKYRKIKIFDVQTVAGDAVPPVRPRGQDGAAITEGMSRVTLSEKTVVAVIYATEAEMRHIVDLMNNANARHDPEVEVARALLRFDDVDVVEPLP
ncbi:unnamed protein product [Amoebophrya sp. A120]|nr:unnamed protein product [Amoebophrya sp. A120]|eukprot:GSA120T00014089001.1